MVIFTEEIFIRMAIVLLSFAGFVVARHVWKHKHSENAPLVCPVRFDCASVVHSDYNKFFNIPVEILGMGYYAFIFFSYTAFVTMPYSLPNFMVGVMAVLSFVAFAFSMYLIGVQIFILKKGCSWCYTSAFICVLIFSLTALSYDFSHLVNLFLK